MTEASLGFDSISPASADAVAVGFSRQVMSADLLVHEDGRARGTRLIVLQNDRISVEVLVDRGLDIGRARIEQVPMSWSSPVGLVSPALVDQRDSEFLRGFHGGLLTTCGLDHIGHPVARDASRFGYAHRTIEHMPMHGRISAIPATLLGYGVVERDDGYEAFVAGTVSQVAIFGEHLVLERRISIKHRSSRVVIDDTVTNRGYAPSPLATMYHINVGWPVFAPDAQVAIGGAPVFGDSVTAIQRPTPGASQIVTIYAVSPDENGRGNAEVANPQMDSRHEGGVRVSWCAKDLPTLVRWQLTNAAGHYVLGLEPSTGVATPDHTLAFPTLAPGESRRLGVEIELTRQLRQEDRE